MSEYCARQAVGCDPTARIISMLIAGAGLVHSSALAADDPFQEQYRYLRGQSSAQVGREAILEGYKKLIDAYPNDPRIADAMFNVGSLYENEDPAIGLKGEPAEALVWYRKAAAAAAPGSEMWIKARRYLAGRLPYTGADGIREADELLKEIAQASQGNWNQLAQLEVDLLSQSLRKEDPLEAHRHCLNLLNWYQDPARIPTDAREKARLDQFIFGAANGMIQAWCTAQGPKEERIARLHELFQQHTPLDRLQNELDKAIARINRDPSTPEVPAVIVQNAPRSRKILLVVNIVALCVVAVIACWRAYFRRPRTGAR